MVYPGTLIVQGWGLAEVAATGTRTEMGAIGRSLGSIREEKIPLEREVSRIVATVAAVGLFLCTVTVVAYGLIHADWITGLLAGITLAMAILPRHREVMPR
jgi:Ca2+-transporting ATPase